MLCFSLLGRALLSINRSIAYTSWTARGIMLTTIVATIAFGEHFTWPNVVDIVMVNGF